VKKMALKANDIVTVITQNGEYVGKLVSQDGSTVELKNPRFLTMSEQGMGFSNGIAMTGEHDPKECILYNISLVVKTNEEVANAYRQMTSGLVAPQSSLIV
jgi:hypothetical protein